jgi:hypothetical protein
MEMTPASSGQPAQVFVQLMDTLRPRNEDGSAGDPPAISPTARNIKDVMVQGTPMTTPDGEIKIPLLSEVEVLVKKNRNLEGDGSGGPWVPYQQTDLQGLRIGTLSKSFGGGTTPVPDWIGWDADQFRLKVSLPDKKGIAGGKVSAWISTKSPPNPLGADWNDDETEIELIEQPAGSGIFYSARQLLVADDVDDKQAVQAVWEGGPTVNIAQNADNTKNDPTHKIALGGWVYLKLPDRPTAGAIAQVPIEKVVNVEPVILSTGIDPPTWATTPEVVRDNDLKLACERMATVGIKLEFPTKADGTVKIPTPVGNPAGVSADGEIDEPLLRTNLIEMSPEAAALFNASAPNAGVIRVYFAKDLVQDFGLLGGRHAGGKGSATFPSRLAAADKKYANRILIGMEKRTLWTLAHELMHPLLDSAHLSNEYDFKNTTATTRLWAITDDRVTFDATKRILHDSDNAYNQRKALRNSKLARPPKR